MNKKLNTESIRQMLNRSSARLDQPTLARLRDVRVQAMARYDARSTAPAFALAGALSGALHGAHRSHYFWAGIVLFAALLFSSATYLQHALEHDNSDVDIAILTDDLPIDAYVD
jgi:fatty acid desaturase